MARPSKELEKEWADKLKASGFEDIEQPDGLLKAWHSTYFLSRYDPGSFEAKQSYFNLANQFLNDYAFSSPLDKTIWRLHANGHSTREIANTLKGRVRRRRKTAIHDTIKRLFKIMVTQ